MILPRETVRPFLVALLLPVCLAAAIPLLCSLLAAAQRPAPDPSSGLINPQGIVFNSANRKVYAVDQAHAAVSVIDTAGQTVRSVEVGTAPVSIAVDSVSGRAYVANSGDGTVSIVDGISDKVLATVAVGAHPYSIAANSRTGMVYVSHTFSDRTTVVDAATGGVTQLGTGSADLIAVDAAANTAYLLGYEGGTLTVLEGAGLTLRKQEAGRHAWGMAVNEATHTLYVARMGTGDVFALRGTSSFILPAGHTPCAVAINPRTNTIYVANYGDGSVTVLDAETGRSVATIPVGVHPQALAVDVQRSLVYVANTSSGTVTLIDEEQNKRVATLPAGKAPYALAVDPGSSKLYVANQAGERPFTIVDTRLPHDANRRPTVPSK
jgi:YVTN family beta-propeller protein